MEELLTRFDRHLEFITHYCDNYCQTIEKSRSREQFDKILAILKNYLPEEELKVVLSSLEDIVVESINAGQEEVLN